MFGRAGELQRAVTPSPFGESRFDSYNIHQLLEKCMMKASIAIALLNIVLGTFNLLLAPSTVNVTIGVVNMVMASVMLVSTYFQLGDR